MEKIVEAPFFNVASVISEAQTFQDWVPLCNRSQILSEPSHFRKLLVLGCTLPWPFSNRICYIGVTAVPVKNEKSFLLNMKTVDSNSWVNNFQIPRNEDSSDTVECIIHMCSVLIENLSENK